MLLAIAVPSQWIALGIIPSVTMGVGLIGGSYLLCLGMYIAAIWDVRGIPGGGAPLNRLVASLYGAGTAMTLVGSALLVIRPAEECNCSRCTLTNRSSRLGVNKVSTPEDVAAVIDELPSGKRGQLAAQPER
jgi:hypothetical protein